AWHNSRTTASRTIAQVALVRAHALGSWLLRHQLVWNVMRISFVEPIKQSACSPEGIVIALLRQIPCRNSQPDEQSIVIIPAHGEHYLPVLFVVAHGFSGSTVTLELQYLLA